MAVLTDEPEVVVRVATDAAGFAAPCGDASFHGGQFSIGF